MKRPVDQLLAHRRLRKSLTGVVAFSVVLGLIIVPVENGSGKINSISEGLYWAVITITGVGYGDFAPVTLAGRIIAMLLAISGVVMLGLLVSLIADVLNKRQEAMYWSRSFERLDELSERLTQLEHKLQYLVREEAEKKPRDQG
jgi:voltage-gated potassium channel